VLLTLAWTAELAEAGIAATDATANVLAKPTITIVKIERIGIMGSRPPRGHRRTRARAPALWGCAVRFGSQGVVTVTTWPDQEQEVRHAPYRQFCR
jgi:hypothetical protein